MCGLPCPHTRIPARSSLSTNSPRPRVARSSGFCCGADSWSVHLAQQRPAGVGRQEPTKRAGQAADPERLHSAGGGAMSEQQAAKIPRVGFLAPGAPAGAPTEAFRQGLAKLGYVDSQNIRSEERRVGKE